MTKKTLEEIEIFKAYTAQRWPLIGQEFKSKIAYAIFKISKCLPKSDEILVYLRIEHCLTDEKTKEILRDDKGNFKYSKEGQLALERAWREELKKEYEFLPYLATELPELSDIEKEILDGFVL